MNEGRETVCPPETFVDSGIVISSGRQITARDAVSLVRILQTDQVCRGLILLHDIPYETTTGILRRELVTWVFPVALVLVSRPEVLPLLFRQALRVIRDQSVQPRVNVLGEHYDADFNPRTSEETKRHALLAHPA